MTHTTAHPADPAEFSAPPADPMTLLSSWLATAQERGAAAPTCLTLSTIGENGPSARIISIKDIEEDALIFASSAVSRKGRELLADPRCAMTFFWGELKRQVRISGTATPCHPEISNRIFSSRRPRAQAIAVASTQSAPLDNPDELIATIAEVEESGVHQRPKNWHAWRFIPTSFEFWFTGAGVLNRRLYYERDGSGWTTSQLQP